MMIASSAARSSLRVVHRRCLSTRPPAVRSSAGSGRTTAGSGISDPNVDLSANKMTASRGPVSWGALGLVAVAAASAVSYYQIERERRLEEAMGKIVSSESEGWSPVPSQLAPRKWKQNESGEWFPIVNDVWGAGTIYLVGTDRDFSLLRELTTSYIVTV